MNEYRRVLFCTNNFLEPHHYAIAAMLRIMRGTHFTIGAKRFFENDLTARYRALDRFVLGEELSLIDAVKSSDLVHCTIDGLLTLSAAQLAIDNNVPLVISFLGAFDIWVKLKRPADVDALYPIISGAAAVTVPAPSQCALIEHLFHRSPVLLPVPVWPARSSRVPKTIEKPYLISCGRLIERKGHDQAIACLTVLPHHNLVVIGDGPERERLLSLGKQLGVSDRVTFTGPLPLDETLELLKAAEALLHLSKAGPAGDQEGIPQIILWAHQECVPVIATASGAVPDVIRSGETGLISEPSPTALAEALASLPARRDALTRAALRAVRTEHSIRTVRRTLENIYQSASRAGSIPSQSEPSSPETAELLSLVEGLDARAAIQAIYRTNNHLIARVSSVRFGDCALKVRTRPWESGLLTVREAVALDRIGEAQWAPRLLAYNTESGWLLRRWIDGQSLDHLSNPLADRDRLALFCKFSSTALSFIHDDPTRVVLKDFKLSNIVFDGANFVLVDFDSISTISHLRSRPIRKGLLGSGKYRHFAPELMAREFGNVEHVSDYFSFATAIASCTLGGIPWSNVESNVDIARSVYGRVSCCRFRGHQDKVFSEQEGDNATTEVQPRVQAGGGEVGSRTGRGGGAGRARSGPARERAAQMGPRSGS